jgi:hypothetical protein
MAIRRSTEYDFQSNNTRPSRKKTALVTQGAQVAVVSQRSIDSRAQTPFV